MMHACLMGCCSLSGGYKFFKSEAYNMRWSHSMSVLPLTGCEKFSVRVRFPHGLQSQIFFSGTSSIVMNPCIAIYEVSLKAPYEVLTIFFFHVFSR